MPEKNLPVFFTGAAISAIPIEVLSIFNVETMIAVAAFLVKVAISGLASVWLNKKFNSEKK